MAQNSVVKLFWSLKSASSDENMVLKNVNFHDKVRMVMKSVKFDRTIASTG